MRIVDSGKDEDEALNQVLDEAVEADPSGEMAGIEGDLRAAMAISFWRLDRSNRYLRIPELKRFGSMTIRLSMLLVPGKASS